MDYVGYVDEINRFYVAGWVADRDKWKESLSVDIIVNGAGVGTCAADKFRSSLDDLHPDATGRYDFRFYFANPLPMYREQEVSVRVSGTTYYLIQDKRRIPAIQADPYDSGHRPLGPILISTMGRTGSTAVMALLAQHPNIVVAGKRPYEVEMGCYYSYALRTLLATGDHERSLRTDQITAVANRFHIGFNPYFDASFASVFKDQTGLQRFLTNRLPRRVGRAFRDIILDYYEDVATDQGLDFPIYFAEKTLPERDSRLGIRFMFPNVREIVLIRDLRDIACSSTSSNGIPFDRVVEDTIAAARQLLAILDEEDRAGVMFLKYEDFVMEKAKTTAELFRFLGLASVMSDDQAMGELFSAHATSASPRASIGRWEHDLSSDQRRKCEAFNPYLHRMGYTV